MKIRCFILISLLLCLCIGARADNVVTISSVEGAPEEEVTVSIGLNNTDAVSSIQVSIPLNENLSLVEGSGTMSNRCQNHSLVVGVKDGTLNVFIYSISMAAIEGNSGEVATLRLKLGSQPATIPLTPSKIVLTDVRGTAIEGSAQSGNVTIRCAKAQYSTMEVDFGEVPIRSTYTRTVTVTNVGNADLVISRMLFSDINIFSTTTTLPLTIPAGGSQALNITYAPVERGSINRTLKVECNSVSKLNTIKLKAQPFAVNELHIQDASGISDEEVTITMTMNNMDAISGYQVEFTLPSQLEYVDGSFALSDRKQDHTYIATLNGNVLLIMVYSGSDSPLTGEDGVIGTFRVKLAGRNGTMLTPTKTVLSATIDNMVTNVVSAVYGGYVSISSPRISTNSSLDFGAVSVTEPCEKTFNIYNGGSVPLTVSRIVFDNENLSVKETLPLVIPAWQSQNITVVYSSVEETSFEATMHIYSNDPDLRLRDVVVRGSRFAPNYLTISTPDIYYCDDLAIEIEADTYDPIAALQFDVTYPSDFYELSDNQVVLEERAEGMTVAARQISENKLRYFCYFISGGSIAPGDGKLMTLLLKPKSESIPPGIYNVSVTNIKLGTQEMADKYAGYNIYTSFEVKSYPQGDANGDEKVTIVDAVLVVNHILGNASDRFIFDAANVDGDSEITISDAIGIVNIILGIGGESSYADNHEYVDLGLPSGTLWATCNIGASSPEDYGDYFAWGEIDPFDPEGKTTFDWNTYKWCKGSYNTLTKYCNNSSYGNNGFTDYLIELEEEDDAAYVNWGPAWRMPSKGEFQELINSSYTTTEWTTQNGVYGHLITSNLNGNSIFLPAAGCRYDSSLGDVGFNGGYWSRTLHSSDPNIAWRLFFYSGGYIGTNEYDRCFGFTVRPVRLSE